MKKMLMISTVPSMIGQFNMNNIKMLKSIGYQVEVGCNWNDTSVWSKDRIASFIEELEKKEIMIYQIDFSRSPMSTSNYRAYKQLETIVKSRTYDFIHCHTPVGSVISRLLCKKYNIKCIYTAHGFHFFSGAPLKNWIMFYPIEKYLSKYTDVLITINQEDYERAKQKFQMKKVKYIPGVGIDISKISKAECNRKKLLSDLKLDSDVKLFLSVGELSNRKNQRVIIETLPYIDKKVHYLIVGQGDKKEEFLKIANKLNVFDRVHFLGYRKDVFEIMKCCDLFVFPSLQEGLPVALMEAMASGLLCIASNIRGNCDLLENQEEGYLCHTNTKEEYVEILREILSDKLNIKGNITYDMNNYNVNFIDTQMKEVYEGISSIRK